MQVVLTGERNETVIDSGRLYTEGEPVRVQVRKRAHRFAIGDGGQAVRLAGKPSGWLAVAQQVADDFDLNVNRSGVVFVPTVYLDWVDGLAARVADASLAVYEALLELDDTA